MRCYEIDDIKLDRCNYNEISPELGHACLSLLIRPDDLRLSINSTAQNGSGYDGAMAS